MPASADHEALRFAPIAAPSLDSLPSFAREMGLAGMGGSLFPGSIKLKAARNLHTLVINAVECEPGIEIDEALLHHETDAVRIGLVGLRKALNVETTVLATKKACAGRVRTLADALGASILEMPDYYPGGAERLIIARLDKRKLPASVLPMQRGYLVFSVASLWAIGRRLRDGEPSIWRPLSLVVPGRPTRNLIAPIGCPIGTLLERASVTFNPATHLLIAGGRMMGSRVSEGTAITKGTNAVFVLPIERRFTKPEEPCILCGSCFDACPLGLHPTAMADRIRERQPSRALKAQLNECFLCGACSAVCPSEIHCGLYRQRPAQHAGIEIGEARRRSPGRDSERLYPLAWLSA